MAAGDVWKIGYADYVVTHQHPLENETLDGHVKTREQVIKLNADLHEQKAAATELHELLHAIADVYSIPLGDREEAIVRGFEVGLAALFRDNGPQVAKMIETLGG